jgi:hypothetical protein
MAVGARATITTRHAGQSNRQVRWLNTTTGYASQNEPVLHFGLGGATSVEELSIDWPSGRRDTFGNVAANRYLRITEGLDANVESSVREVQAPTSRPEKQ